MRWVYLLHLSAPLGSERKVAQHYLGSADDLTRRLEEHRTGRGARMLAVATERGISFEIVRVWPGDRTTERQLKRHGHSPLMCPVCAGASAFRRGRIVCAEQLELDLSAEELPSPPVNLRPDWREYQSLREMAQRRAELLPRISLELVDQCL